MEGKILVIDWPSPSRQTRQIVSAEQSKPSFCPCAALMASWSSLPTLSFTLWIALELTFCFPREQFSLYCFFFFLSAVKSKVCCEGNLGARSQLHDGLISRQEQLGKSYLGSIPG